MARAFKAGDIVQLKSGGPRMTLTSVDDRGCVRTVWFGGAEKEHGRFHLDGLISAPGELPNDDPMMKAEDPGADNGSRTMPRGGPAHESVVAASHRFHF